MTDTAVRIIIEGAVQGVGYRAWAVREARRRGLRGWVRNRCDGSVEALLIGATGDIETMIEICRQGPRLAQVKRIVSEAAADDGVRQFHERPSV